MAEVGSVLLAQKGDLPAGHRQYLLAATLAGHLSLGRRLEAAIVLNRHSADYKGTTWACACSRPMPKPRIWKPAAATPGN